MPSPRHAALLLASLLLTAPAARAAEPTPPGKPPATRSGKPGRPKPGVEAPGAVRKPAPVKAPIVWEPEGGKPGRPRPAVDFGADEPTEVVRAGRCGG